MVNDCVLLRNELVRRELARRRYADYLPFVHGGYWKQTRMAQYLAEEIQTFLESDTGNAYDKQQINEHVKYSYEYHIFTSPHLPVNCLTSI